MLDITHTSNIPVLEVLVDDEYMTIKLDGHIVYKLVKSAFSYLACLAFIDDKPDVNDFHILKWLLSNDDMLFRIFIIHTGVMLPYI